MVVFWVCFFFWPSPACKRARFPHPVQEGGAPPVPTLRPPCAHPGPTNLAPTPFPGLPRGCSKDQPPKKLLVLGSP